MRILASDHYVVVWDPSGENWDGGVVTATQARVLEERGVELLPVIPSLFVHSGAAGFVKRSWGSGIPLDTPTPRFVAPLMMYLDPEYRGVHWKARLVPSGPGREGMIRFAADNSQRSPLKAFYREENENALMTRNLGELDEYGGWTIGGEGLASFGTEGHYGFSLYGSAPGLRAVWVAATTAPVTA